ncbi:AMP-binding protein [Mycobacterium sp. LTG2003]
MSVSVDCWSAPTLGSALLELISAQSVRDRSVSFPTGRGCGETISLVELDTAATRFAHALLGEADIQPGDVVGMLVPTSPQFLTAWFGILRSSATATVLPVTHGNAAKQASHLRRLIEIAGVRTVVVGDGYGPVADELHNMIPELRLVPASLGTPGNGALPAVRADDLAILQFTSGSTAAPRGVTLTHRNIMAGLAAISTSAEITTEDVWVLWTPLYHDMGLFSLMSGVLNGDSVHAISPQQFVRSPESFLSLMAHVRGTITTGPNFSYDLMVQAAREQLCASDDVDFSSWRFAFNGGEVISPRTIRAFNDTFGPAGVARSVMYPVYGMAEATLAVSFPAPGSIAESIWVDREQLGKDGAVRVVAPNDPAGTEIVRVGRPVADMQIRIVGDDGTVHGDRQLGEIQIRGESVTHGYYRDPAATEELFDDGWLRTGDLGFRIGRDLYVGGRRKEMVIVHGRNYFPTDAEHVARQVPGVYRGHVAAVAEINADAGEHLGIIVESEVPETEYPDLADRVRRDVAAELGLSAVRVHVVPPGFLTRSTSGKWQRLAAAKRLAQQRIKHVDTETVNTP